MSFTQTVEFQLPTEIDSNQQDELHRSFLLHLVTEKKMKMRDALKQLSIDDQQWLAYTILQTAQENLYVACHISDEAWAQKYWQRYGDLLGHLFARFYKSRDVSNHGQLLSILRTIVRRYNLIDLTPEQIEITQRLTLRLHEQHLQREDILAVTRMLEANGLHTLLDLSPIADQLVASYIAELGRD
ncbi:MAG: hypothetical protein AAF639_20750 [Chloroflexota bacterium]